MAATNVEVKQVFRTSLDTEIIDKMIATAELLLVQHVDPVGTVSAELRDEIKIWLAAHFCAIRDRQVKERSGDGVRFMFDGGIGEDSMGLSMTMWGRQAMMLDPTGKLANLGKGKRLTFRFSNDQCESIDESE